ncbi:hypothetical protein D1F64_00670 [Breoghania sp. L-A4]|nr:hypothetical protein D1F64_00670 [Breoghania sp. L-A4]
MHLSDATRLSKRLAGAGFLALGGFHPRADDSVPAQGGAPARTLLLIGNAGPALWQRFSASPEYADGAGNPLDRFTRRVLSAIAAHFGFTPLFPFDGPPYHPFQGWALRAGGFSRAPMGVLAHEIYGPWAAFRAAFVSTERFGTFRMNGVAGPCESCTEKPCIAACPAGALTPTAYDVPLCHARLMRDHAGDAGCILGCMARLACPHGAEFTQTPEQARHHMRSFVELFR